MFTFTQSAAMTAVPAINNIQCFCHNNVKSLFNAASEIVIPSGGSSSEESSPSDESRRNSDETAEQNITEFKKSEFKIE